MDPEQSTALATAPVSPPARKPVSRRTTIIGSVIALAVVAALGWLAWDLTHPSAGTGGGPAGARAGGGGGPGGPGGPGGGGGRPGGRAPPTTVGIAVAAAMDIPIVLESLGTVVPQATVRVRPQVSGVLQSLLFKEGQLVKKGDLLATIDPRQFEMALQQAIGQRQRDQSQIEAAKVTLARFQTLLQQDSIARQEVDTQAALVKQLEGTVVIDRANEGTARLNLSYTRIVAPVSGRVGLRTVDVGNVVSTSDTNGVAVITQLAPIDVEFTVPQDQAPDLLQRTGSFMEAKALDRTRSNVLDVGVFASLDNQVDPQTGTVRAKARFNNARSMLFPSQFVNIQLMVRTIKDAIVVPVSALRHGNDGDYVFVLNQDRTVAQRPVKAGQATVDKVQIVSGVQLGERVVTEGADRLKDGARVILPGDAPGGSGGGDGGGGGRGGRRRQGASAPAGNGPAVPAADAPGPNTVTPVPAPRGAASGAAPRAAAAAAPAAPGATFVGPSPEQRQRFLDQVKDDPEQLARRKAFLEKIDQKDPAALERWQRMMERRQGGGQGAAQ
ncbi:efflux RND transporter periplasmic adaptor subunit [Caenimonas terrae]|uniref:Efflux RND transporter periplasmic adaptor subunit n=1 Tax=Caenimonas terrae TaxID=696074 RepID=A0ABW0NEJ9_9BURK